MKAVHKDDPVKDSLDISTMQFWQFNDLKARGIVNSRVNLLYLQQKYGFPRSIRLSGGGKGSRAIFNAHEVTRWVQTRIKQNAAE